MSNVETLDLVHSYLTEKRVLGITRFLIGDQPRLALRHHNYPNLTLATIKATGTKATIDSLYLKRYSANSSGYTSVDLTDPQGLDQLEKILKNIVNNFNEFYKTLNAYKKSIEGLVGDFPSIGTHVFSK